MTDFLPWIALALALFPIGFALDNLRRMAKARGPAPPNALVSILIPARNEEAHISACLDAAIAQQGVTIEVLVMDDGSSDRTATIVSAYATRDARVRLLACPPLPKGWTGKVHACARLAEAARGTHFLFIDADVRLARDAAARMAGHAARQRLAMVTGVPRQIIGSLGEALTVPMINLLLIGYLPGGGRAETERAELGAACGQLILFERSAYETLGGHGAIRGSLHDGLQLARKLRGAGFRTEMVEGVQLAECRMYDGLRASWNGFIKNAHEGMATPVGLPIWTTLLAGAHIWPFFLLPEWQAALAILLVFALRAAITFKTREAWWTVPLHPFAVLVGLAIQWTALVRMLIGRPAGWKGRAYSASGAA
jgi:cellulose synthase/poly-beta-1,6-N-acetylglucosamine synthase-like glycosyltransferase